MKFRNIVVLVIVLSISLSLLGCSKNDNVNLPQNENNEQQETNNIDNIANMSFEERTKDFFDKKDEIKDDNLRTDFANVRLNKVNNHYEIVADLIGDVKIDTDVMDEAIEKIKDEKLEKLEIKTVSNETLVIYSKRPEETKTYAKDMPKEDGFEYEVNELGYVNLGTYDDEDWFMAKSDEEWLNQSGLPMYILYEGSLQEKWPLLRKAEDGYYLYARNLAGAVDISRMITVNEKNAVRINVLPTEKIVLDINDFYGNLPEDYEFKVMTVEEYYNSSPTVLEDNLKINASNMSEANYFSIGLDIKDGMIHVISRCDGP